MRKWESTGNQTRKKSEKSQKNHTLIHIHNGDEMRKEKSRERKGERKETLTQQSQAKKK